MSARAVRLGCTRTDPGARTQCLWQAARHAFPSRRRDGRVGRAPALEALDEPAREVVEGVRVVEQPVYDDDGFVRRAAQPRM